MRLCSQCLFSIQRQANCWRPSDSPEERPSTPHKDLARQGNLPSPGPLSSLLVRECGWQRSFLFPHRVWGSWPAVKRHRSEC